MTGPLLGTKDIMVRNSNNVFALLDLRITQRRLKIEKKKDIKLYPEAIWPY